MLYGPPADDDINIRDWKDVIWAMTTRVDPTRDYLDFASPVSGLGSKMGMDAINKWPGETNRESADFQRLRRSLDVSLRAP